MFNPKLVAPVVRQSGADAANIGASGTFRDVLKSHGAKGFTNWRGTNSEEGRKATYFKGSNGQEYMILTGKNHSVQVGDTPDLNTPVILNTKLGAYFTAPGSSVEENTFDE